MKLVGRDKLLGNIKEVSEVACAIFQWLKDNKMKTNADKYHALLNTSNALTVEISEVQKSKYQNQCLVDNSPIYGLAEKKANNECYFQITVQLQPFSMDDAQQAN